MLQVNSLSSSSLLTPPVSGCSVFAGAFASGPPSQSVSVGVGQPGFPVLLWSQMCSVSSAAAHCLQPSQCASPLAAHAAKVIPDLLDVLPRLLTNTRLSVNSTSVLLALPPAV